METRAEALLDELSSTGKEMALPAGASRGMKQKVAIACGLLHEPDALVVRRAADRPRPARHSADEVDDRRARPWPARAVIVSSHLLHLVEEICTRIVIINHGVKVADGTIG